MKKAFTMIELIFVIVIIGILASVAIPKLSATRDDSKVSVMIANARTAFGDLSAYYTSKQASIWNDDTNGTLTNATSVSFYNPGCDGRLDHNKSKIVSSYALCNGEAECLKFTGEVNGVLTIINGLNTIDPVCTKVQTDKAIVNLKMTHNFGGKKVIR